MRSAELSVKRMAFFLTPTLLLAIAVIALSPGVRAADWQYWNTEAVSGKLSDRVKAGMEMEFRWTDDASELSYKHAQISLDVKVTDWFTAGVAYRQADELYTSSGVEEDWYTEYQPMVNLTVSTKLEGWKISNRFRPSYRVFDINKDDVWRFRNKLTITSPWKLTPLSINPYLADEIFLEEHKGGIYRNRFYVGLNLKIIEHLNGGVFYLCQATEGSDGWENINVGGTKIKFAF